MNQSFKKKVIAASVAATFVAVGAGFVAIPGIAPIGAAQANQFADTTQAVAVTAGVSVPVSTTAGTSVTNQSFVITENVGGAISTGNIILTLTNGAKWVEASAVGTATAGAAIGGKAVGTAATVLDGLIIDSANKANLVIPVTAASATGTGKAITVSAMKIDTSAMTAGQTVSVSISSSSTSTGLTTGVSTLLANVAAPGVTVTADQATVPTYPKTGATTVVNTITVAEVIMGSLADMSSATDEITVTLPSGYSWIAAPTKSDTTLTTSVTSYSGNVAKFNVTNSATASAGKVVITPGSNGIFIPSSATDGNVDATVAVKLADGTTKTSTVTLFKVASAATTSLAYTTGTTTAPTTYSALYAGRATQSTGLDVAVKEVVPATLLGGGTVSLTLPTGVTAGKDYTGTEVTAATGVGAISTVTDAAGTTDETGKSSIMTTLGADTNTTDAGKVTFKLDDLDLADTAVVGDLNVTVGGTANATAGTVKVATVIRATDTSVSATVPTVTAGSSLSLPDIVITESKAGALVAGNALMGVYIANANGAALTTTGATVVAKKADGTDVSTTIFGAASATLTASGANGLVTFPVTTASSSSTGPVTITISGLKATVNSSATAGDITAVVGGATAGGADTALTSDKGAKAFKKTVTVGKVVSATVPSIPAATVTGAITAQTISASVVPAGNDQGKQGSVFVAAVLPASLGGGVFFMNSSSAWTQFTSCATAPVYSTGALGSVSNIPVISTAANLTSLVGTQVYVGYGTGGALSPAGTACNSMLTNGTYGLAYTIQ